MSITHDYNRVMAKQGWNVAPQEPHRVPCSQNPLVNSAIAIATCAYPQIENLRSGGRAEKYSKALLSYMLRVSRSSKYIAALPDWVTDLKTDAMFRLLESGSRNFQRALTIRDLLVSASIMKEQHERSLNDEKATFSLEFSPDLRNMRIEIPLTETTAGYVLAGKVPESNLSSLRAAILRHQPALKRYAGPAVKLETRDEEYDYQNAYVRHVRPSLFVQHIMQVVWESAVKYSEEAKTRGLSIDEILMRKANWAADIHLKAAERAPTTIFRIRQLGVRACWCKLIHFREPSPDS